MIELQKLFITKNLSLSLAESCTGGQIASIITKTPGSSLYFLGGFVVYSDKLKIDILGVEKELIKEKTANDKQVAIQMCRGALEKTGSDYAIAVTGDAGPCGLNVGVVFGAIGNKEKIFAGKIPNLEGLNREQIQKKCSIYLLHSLINWVERGEVIFDNK
jgi:PncC family amidohydrolase